MDAVQARTFDRHSLTNATILIRTATTKGCHCQPYIDWFTYRRWQAQGFQVQKGEHSTRLACFAPVQETDPETGETRTTGKRPWTSHLFCRCQVTPIERRTP